MKLSSPAFENGSVLPAKYTCEGEDISPPLQFSDVPAEAKSLVLLVDDPDAPSHIWIHWLLFNIDPTTQEIPEDSTPEEAIEGINSSAQVGYDGPCPPSGTHRYFFKLYALSSKLDLPKGASAKEVEVAMAGHIIAEAQLMATCSCGK